MNKPWDNEPTPIIDKSADNAEDNQLAFINIWFDARSLERRLRYAEKLLAKVIDGEGDLIHPIDHDVAAYLEAAKAEDNA